MPKKISSKLFVLDTNVLLHDPSSLFRFEEHDIYLPMITLEELDNNKKGVSEVARNARQTSRYLEEIMGIDIVDLNKGCSFMFQEVYSYKQTLLNMIFQCSQEVSLTIKSLVLYWI